MLFHPLSGSDPATLLAVIRANGPVPARQWGRLALALAGSLGRAPFSLIERGLVPAMRRRAPRMEPPIFIVGHWRSGTTHLYNVLTSSGRFGFVPPLATGLPWDMLLLARALRPLLARMLPPQRYIDPIPVHLHSPQEDEAAMANMQPLSFYHGLYFPRHLRDNFQAGVFFDDCQPAQIERWQSRFMHLIEKLHLLNAGRRLLIKNPVYTARISMLRQMLPGARFIHVHRDPLTVFASMRHFYFRLLDVLALQPPDTGIIDELILESYPRMMRMLLEQSAGLSPAEFVEIAYDDLNHDPLGQIEQLYEALDLEGFEDDRPALEQYLASTRDYQRNEHELPEHLRQRAEREWAEFIERWGTGQPQRSPAASSSPPPA